MSRPPAAGERAALEALESAHRAVEHIEALAHAIAEGLQDIRFTVPDGAARDANRRFSAKVGLLADVAEDARISIAEEIDRLTDGD